MSTNLTLNIEFIRTDGVAQAIALERGETILLGRDLTCDCRLEGRKVSRRHFRIHYFDDGRIHLQDNGSHNGTFVNGIRVLESHLSGGEVVSVGEWEGKVELLSGRKHPATAPSHVALEESNASPAVTAGTGIAAPKVDNLDDEDPSQTRVVNMNTVWQWQDDQSSAHNAKENVRAAKVTENPIVRALSNVGELDFKGLKDLDSISPQKQRAQTPGVNINADAVALRLMFKVMESLYSTTSMSAFLEEMSVSLLNAARSKAVAVLLPKNGALTPVVLKNRRSDEALQISKTVLEHAVSSRSAITTEDASADERFASGESVLRFDLKAVLVVPLVRDDGVSGAIYLTRDLPFTDSERDLVAALAHVIGIGLERSKLRDQIAKEAETRRTLERFHAPDVVRRLMMQKNPNDSLNSSGLFLENLTATVLFCDLSGFTTFCEGNSPEVVGKLLNSYLAAMTEVVFEHGGTVDKYIGDAIMCIFGAPFSAADDSLRAVRCAVAMRTRFAEMVQDPSFEGIGRGMHVHIGVNSGPVVAGTVGSDRRMEYTALGDTVNIAARFEGIAGPGEIVIGAETHTKSAHAFRMRPLGSVPIKGKSKEVEAWAVEDLI